MSARHRICLRSKRWPLWCTSTVGQSTSNNRIVGSDPRAEGRGKWLDILGPDGVTFRYAQKRQRESAAALKLDLLVESNTVVRVDGPHLFGSYVTRYPSARRSRFGLAILTQPLLRT
eukprot:6491036-Amphidinium_carterae.1